ncbi:hypothetical protein [Paraburkholderia hospita]|uniref:hypothetical protein n=1 Tax=Paraburkholderia hospita TaxID=169430 RepID=UPI0013750266|nr:hypothetical protein [Paraburkholderia hospita]
MASTKVNVLAAPDAPSILDSRWLVFARVADLCSLSKAAIALDMPQNEVGRNSWTPTG